MEDKNLKEKIINDLAINFKEGDETIVENYIELYLTIASASSNRNKEDKILYPYVYEAVKSAYARRGDEGVLSNNESGFSITYIDIVKKLKEDVKAIRLLP